MKEFTYLTIIMACTIIPCHCYVTDTVKLCADVETVDCSTHYNENGDETVCATDGNTYDNKCFYVKAKCLNSTLGVRHMGTCMNVTQEDTVGNTTSIKDNETESMATVKDEICQKMNGTTCDDFLDPICGSNGKFYLNSCVFTKEKCVDDTLQTQMLSKCKSP